MYSTHILSYLTMIRFTYWSDLQMKDFSRRTFDPKVQDLLKFNTSLVFYRVKHVPVCTVPDWRLRVNHRSGGQFEDISLIRTWSMAMLSTSYTNSGLAGGSLFIPFFVNCNQCQAHTLRRRQHWLMCILHTYACMEQCDVHHVSWPSSRCWSWTPPSPEAYSARIH